MALTEQQEIVASKQTKNEVANAIGNSGIADSILASFDKLASQGQLVFPKNYSVGNQLKLMYTNISQNGLLEKATKISIGEALTEAVCQGLEIDKKQCYFIVYGNKMQMFRSYYGDVKVAKDTKLVKDVQARIIYEGDEWEVATNEYGEEYITGHKTQLENRDNAIKGAYAWSEGYDNRRRYCIMTWKEIQANWSKSKSGGAVSKEFPQEMAKRTVIRRLVKMIFNTAPSNISEETQALIGNYNRTTEQEYIDNDYSQNKTRKTNVVNVITDDDGIVVENDEINEEIQVEHLQDTSVKQ